MSDSHQEPAFTSAVSDLDPHVDIASPAPACVHMPPEAEIVAEPTGQDAATATTTTAQQTTASAHCPRVPFSPPAAISNAYVYDLRSGSRALVPDQVFLVWACLALFMMIGLVLLACYYIFLQSRHSLDLPVELARLKNATRVRL